MLRQSGVRLLFSASAFKTSDYAGDDRRGRRRAAPRSSARSFVDRRTDWDELLAPARRRPRGARRAAWPSCPSTTRSTSSTRAGRRASPRARRSRTTTSSTTASSSRELLRLHRATTAMCIPVPFYHCFGMVMGNLGALAHGACIVIPAPAFEPGRDARGGRRPRACTSLYGVPTMFIAELDHADFDALRPDLAAHRDHGRLAVPGRGHEEGRRPHAHGGGGHLLRHDRDLAGLHADRASTTRSSGASARSGASHPHVEVKVDRPRDRRSSCRAASRASCARAATRVMLGYWETSRSRRPRPSTAPAGCTPATSRRWTTRATSTSSGASRT